MIHLLSVVVVAAMCAAGVSPAVAGQARTQRPARGEEGLPARPQGAELTPAELMAMLDAYAMVQSEDFLKLSEGQTPQYVQRLRALQQTRRRNLQARNLILLELQRLSNPQNPASDDALRDRLKALHEHDARAANELQAAYDALDQVLDVGQQARFRVFEERMERKKLDLLLMARQRPGLGRGRLK